MSVLLNKEISRLKKSILHLSTVVEENVRTAVESISKKDIELAKSVILKDNDIDRMEIDIEEECLKILALHQPVAADLRYVIACMKMNNDLERIGDLAVNIAKRVKHLTEDGRDMLLVDFTPMMDRTRHMLKQALDSLINMDMDKALQVLNDDDEIDLYNKNIHSELKAMIKNNPAHVEYYLNLLSVSRHLERIGDYATNIAEEVIYMVKGDIIRHKTGTDFKEFKEKKV